MLSENIKQGVERAPNRSLLYALGLTDEEIRKPLIGVVSSYNEIVPGHMNLDKIAEAVKAGVRAAGGTPILEVRPFTLKTAAVVTTGSEVAKGRIPDSFTPVVERKLAALGIKMTEHVLVEDGMENVAAAIEQMKNKPVDMILCTGGMSVDPDDSTPGAIKQSGADIVTYGAPVLPGAMFLLGYYADGRPVMGLPGCVMYAKATIFDLVLPRIAAGVRLTKRDFVTLGEGGLCLGCEVCTYPHCGFGGV